uniref:Glia maturation factor beta n=1 Tax=Ursus americanus TaxID=9643 RepID=A0A452SKV9_URSAM
MSESLVVCDVAEDLVEKLRKFRFRKETNNAAIIMKIDKDKRLVVLDEELEGISPDELKDELPERQPRYPFLSALKRCVFFCGQNFIMKLVFFNFFFFLKILFIYVTERQP